jgi:hypothetical protein
LNHEWAELREKAEAKRDELNSAHGVQTFHIECRETLSWIEDKKRILQSTDSLEMDLTGIMTLQVCYMIVFMCNINNFSELHFNAFAATKLSGLQLMRNIMCILNLA